MVGKLPDREAQSQRLVIAPTGSRACGPSLSVMQVKQVLLVLPLMPRAASALALPADGDAADLLEADHAACRGMDPDLYHPDSGRPTDLALARCAECPVRLACLAVALRAEDKESRSGWCGGLGPADRDKVATSLDLDEPLPVLLVTECAARAARLRTAGWTVGEIASELGCSRRTVQRYLRKPAA
jgi:AraC-like DNA-binding protein